MGKVEFRNKEELTENDFLVGADADGLFTIQKDKAGTGGDTGWTEIQLDETYEAAIDAAVKGRYFLISKSSASVKIDITNLTSSTFNELEIYILNTSENNEISLYESGKLMKKIYQGNFYDVKYCVRGTRTFAQVIGDSDPD